MATEPDAKPGAQKPIGTLVNELVGMVIAYVKQETITPIKSLGRYVAFGLAGALLLAVGGAMVILTAIRAAQVETARHLSGSLSWVPYVAGILVGLAGVGWAATRIGKGRK